MAQKAKKDLARANAASLKTLHLLSLLINALFALNAFLRPNSRSLRLYSILSVPALASQFVLERSGRPTRDEKGGVRSPGQDLAGGGLVGYLFDVVWVTWACVVLVVLFGDGAWWLWAVVPAYGGYQAVQLLGKARGLTGMGGMGDMGGTQGEAVPPSGGGRKQRRAA